jgi:hypothetical protein
MEIHTHAATFENVQPLLGGFLFGLMLDKILQRISMFDSRRIGLEAIIQDPLRLPQPVAKDAI